MTWAWAAPGPKPGPALDLNPNLDMRDKIMDTFLDVYFAFKV